MIICMKQWDKQGQEGSRCKLSRNLCSSVILVGAAVLSTVVRALHPGPLLLSSTGSCDVKPLINLPVEINTVPVVRVGFDGAG